MSNLEEKLKNPLNGPRPISFKEYRRRNSSRVSTTKPSKTEEKRKYRGGKHARFNREQAELHRLINITSDIKLQKKFREDFKSLNKNLEKIKKNSFK